MDHVLIVHYGIGILVAACAALFVWRRLGRRLTIYVLTVQIALGIWLMLGGLRAPSVHYGLAVVAWGGYMAANALGRRPGRERIARTITIVSSLLVLVAFAIGYAAVRGHV